MKTKKRKLSDCEIDDNFYILFEDTDLSSRCKTLCKAKEGEVHLSTLQKLQDEVETILANLSERALMLSCQLNKQPLPPQLFSLAKTKSLIVTANPDKPLTLIISQKKVEDYHDSAKKLKIDTSLLPISTNICQSGFKRCSKHVDQSDAEHGSKSSVYPNGTYLRNSTSPRDREVTKVQFEIPNKFWAFMEPYCAELTEDNLKFLEGMLRDYDDYASRRANLDCNDSFNFLPVKQEGGDSISLKLSLKKEPKSLPRKIEFSLKQPLDKSSVFGDLLESINAKFDDNKITDSLNSSSASFWNEKSFLPNKALAKELSVSNSYRPEKKIRQAFIDLGLDPALGWMELKGSIFCDDDMDNDDEDSDTDEWVLNYPKPCSESESDEVGQVIHQKQKELDRLIQQNRRVVCRLISKVKKDLHKQEIQRRLAIADADVIEAYRKLQLFRQTRRIPLKRDRDSSWKTLKDRKKILKELEMFDSRS